MSAYSSLKEMYKDTTQIIQGKDTAGKTVYLLKQFCFFCSVFVIFNRKMWVSRGYFKLC